MRRSAQTSARTAAPRAFSRKQASGSFSASATRTYPAVLITAHGLWQASAAATLSLSAMSISRRETSAWSSPRESHMREKARPRVPVAPVIRSWRGEPTRRQALELRNGGR
jgi:hypothetical protein